MDTGEGCSAEGPGEPLEDWWPIELSEHPELAEVGGSAAVDIVDALLYVLIVHEQPGCYIAVWRVCTHGACEVDWNGSAVHCPCHDSLFGTDGSVQVGPATEPLRSFEVQLQDDTLWVHRPL